MELWTCLPVLGVSLPESVTCGVPARADHVTEALLMPVPVFAPQMQSPGDSRAGNIHPRDPEPD